MSSDELRCTHTLWLRSIASTSVMALDLNAQTAIDLKEARDKVSFDLQTIRDYLFGDCSVFIDAQDDV